MTRFEIIEKHRGKLSKNVSEGVVTAMIVLFQMKRLREMGMLEADREAYSFTEKGYDVVNDILDDGWVMTGQEIGDFLVGADLLTNPGDVDAMVGTLLYLQDNGYEKMKDEFKKMEADLAERGEL